MNGTPAIAPSRARSAGSSDIERIAVPRHAALTVPGRPLVAELSGATAGTWAIALCVSVLVTAFFWVDQNVSCVMCQRGLERGRYFHGPFFAMAVFNLVGPLLGV